MATTAVPIARPRFPRRWLLLLAGVAGVALVAGIVGVVALAGYLGTAHFVFKGASMTPCFADRARLAATPLSASERQALRRGDIVVFDTPAAGDGRAIKRVIAVGGDRLAIHDGQVLVNGVALVEPYVEQSGRYRFPYAATAGDYTVPDGSVFLLGDNRNNSSDSHVYGAVALDAVTHRVTTPCDGQPARP